MAEFYFGSLEEHVLQGIKPGAFIQPGTDNIHAEIAELKERGLEVWPAMPYNTTLLNMAAALPRPASEVVDTIELGPITKQFAPTVKDLASKIGWMTVSQSLATLTGLPRYARSNLEKPEVAIVEGALLGYAPCCTDHYIATAYLGHTLNPVSEALLDSKKFDEWNNPHILCEECATDFPPDA